MLEVWKLQELTYSGKNKDKMVELAVRNNETNTDKAPSRHHLQGDQENIPRDNFDNNGTIGKKDLPQLHEWELC